MRRKGKKLAFGRSHGVEALENRLLLTTTPYTWQNVNIGAGGFVDGIFYDPHNQNVIYARTDIGGLYKTTNDGTTWTQLLDSVGNNTANSGNGTQFQEIGVLSFAIDPENSNNIYADVGEYSGTNGAVFYSTNAGQSWTQTNLSFYVGGNSNGRGDGEQIAVDPNDSNIVFLGSNDHGLWESTNAGHTFTRISTSAFTPTSTTFVLFDPTSATVGNPSQKIYVGINSTSTGTNLYMTSNGGTSWAQIVGTGTKPTAFLPGHAVLSSGNLYLGYGNAEAPNGGSNGLITNGGVYRYIMSTGVWASISPLATAGSFGYDAVGVDPQNPNTIVVTSFDDYSGPDRIWRTVNANAATPTWTEVYDYPAAQNSGYGGYNTTRNTTNAPWTAAFGDGISNWAGTVAINPFNSNQLMYGTGQGIWATNNLSNGGANTQLTAPNSWYFPDTGIEFTAVGGVAAPTSGTPLYSAMGDIGGFANTTLAYSPGQGSIGGSGNATDYAGTNPVDAVIVGSMGTNNGVYTTNGVSFTAFAANPSTGTVFSGGTVAMSANGATIVWAPGGQTVYYSTNNGSAWTLATLGASGTLPTGGVIVSDKVNPNYFYYWTENTNDNSWTLYISSDAGHTFNISAGGALGTGNASLAANPYVAGDLWLSTYTGINHSTNFGASFSHASSFAMSGNTGTMALGAAAPGSTTPAIYVYGTLNSFMGVYRSDDGGNTWLQANDVSHQWGGLIQTVAADPNVFGRVYLGINGRGIIMGNPASSLPVGWADQDINEPGNPGWATSSTTLSGGTVSNQWNIVGGGASLSSSSLSISSLSRSGGVATAISTAANGYQVGQMVTIAGATQSVYDGTFVITGLMNSPAGIASQIGGATEFTFAIASGTDSASGTITATLDDQFNFAYEPVAGSAIISAQLKSLTNADNGHGTPQAGVMYRASANADDPFISLVQTAANSLVLQYRTTTDGIVATSTLGSVPVGSEYVEIIRTGNNFGAFYSTNGTSWTQLGSTVAIAAMPTTANVGLAASASYNPQLTNAVFSNVVVSTGPSVTQAAAANPNPVTGTSTSLSVAGSENGSGAGLTYTWAATGPASVSYTDNGSATALNTTAMFSAAGSYTFTVTITDASSLSVTSSILVTVNQTLSSAVVAPSSTVIAGGSTVGFTVTGFDQFNTVMNPEPVFVWSTTGGGTFTGASFTASQAGGSYTVHATSGTVSPSAAISVVPTIYSGDGLYYIAVSAGTEEIWAGTAGVGSPDYSIAANLLPSLTFNDGNLTVDLSGGDAIPSGGLAFNGIGLNIFDTVGADSVTLNPTNVTVNNDAPITYTQLQTLIFIGGAAPDVFTQAAASVSFAIEPTSVDTLNVNVGTFSIPSPGSEFSPYPLAALNVASGASAVLQTALPAPVVDHTVLILGSLSIGATGMLDLGGNDMIVHGGDLPTLSNDIGQRSILSSIAAATNNQALGIAVNVTSSFDGQNVQSTDVLIKYTYYGDADLSGNVTAADYLLIDNGFNSQSTIDALTGWQNGDFNYDGRINGDDYTLIDNAFNTQNAAQPLAQARPLAIATPSPLHQPNLFSSTSAVPFADSDDTLLKRRHHRESLVQSIKQLND